VIGRLTVLILCLFICLPLLRAHEGHQSVTYRVTPSWQTPSGARILRLRIVDESDQPIATRFSLTIDGEPYVPNQLGSHGLRFVSIHKGRGQSFVASYSRGTGEVIVPLSPGTSGTVTATRGFEYRTATESFEIEGQASEC
jgi:hypothetical protein